jgi:hypothetical protein
MKRFLFIAFFIITSLTFCISTSAYAEENSKVNMDKSLLDSGMMKISYKADTQKIIKVIVEKDDKKYIYNLRCDGVAENYTLQMGNGSYKVTIYENLEGNNYIPVFTDTFDLNLTNDKLVYLNSIQNINWDLKMKAIKKAAALVKGLKSDNQKIDAIYKYVVANYSYDFAKYKNLNKLPNPYIPVIDKTYAERKGICYDYSSLFASMLRSLKIPVKLQMGYSKNVPEYHAWNEVYMSSQKKWIVVDTTYDAQMKKAKLKYSMSKGLNLYTFTKTY